MLKLEHIDLTWLNPEETILLVEFHPNWTWDEYFKIVEWILEKVDQTGKPVRIISVDAYRRMVSPRGDFFARARALFPRMLKSGCSAVYVNPSSITKTLISVYSKLSPETNKAIRVANTLEEAKQIALSQPEKNDDQQSG